MARFPKAFRFSTVLTPSGELVSRVGELFAVSVCPLLRTPMPPMPRQPLQMVPNDNCQIKPAFPFPSPAPPASRGGTERRIPGSLIFPALYPSSATHDSTCWRRMLILRGTGCHLITLGTVHAYPRLIDTIPVLIAIDIAQAGFGISISKEHRSRRAKGACLIIEWV